MAGSSKTTPLEVVVDGHVVTVTHPEKVLFPDDEITKGDLVSYYHRVAPQLLPHLAGRPLTLHRFPAGIGAHGFWQKEAPDGLPPWVDRVELPKEGGTTTYAVLRDAAGLVSVVNQNMVTPHVWLSTADRPGCPDRLVFDLDPAPGQLEIVRDTARLLHDLLDLMGLPAFVKTSGSKGLHVEVPLDGSTALEEVRAFALAVAEEAVARDPDRLSVEHRKAKRGGRLYVDILRNGWAQTVVPAYAVRALPGAPVAAPLEWSEVDDAALDPQRWTIANLFRRLAQRADPWAAMADAAVPLQPEERLAALGRG